MVLQRAYPGGTTTAQICVPLENAVPLGRIAPEEAGHWAALGGALVPFGGLLAAGMRPGETGPIGGDTGTFGTAAVAAALAMGAARVVAAGRNAAVLADLERRLGPRLRPVALSGEVETDAARMQAAAGGPVETACSTSCGRESPPPRYARR